MKDIKELRDKINEIDRQLAALYENRMNAAKEIAEYKLTNNLAVLDKKREKEVLDKNLSYISDENLLPLYAKFVREMMDQSKSYQRYLSNSVYDDVIISKNILSDVHKYINLDRKVMIVSDSGIPDQYIDIVAKQCEKPFVKRFPQGESSKNFDNYKAILDALLDAKFTRNDLVIAIGGGVTTDLAGFVASSYMRGIEFANIPTTLLAQVDASIGGKVGIDFNGVKNIVGAFHKPIKTIIDVETLKTLDERLFLEGISEIIKMALTLDKEFYLYLETLDLDGIKKDIEYIVNKSVMLKSKVVNSDPNESGLRRVLNYGHTIGHAIEALSNGKLLHGESVSIGMTYMVEEPVKSRLIAQLEKYHLPTTCKYTKEELLQYIKLDKKKVSDDKIIVVWCKEIGSFEFREVTLKELEEIIERR